MQIPESSSTSAGFTELRDDLHVLRRRWYVIAATVRIFVVLALVWSLAADTSYRSSARVLINQPPGLADLRSGDG